jgi:hypothetical protein
MAGCLALLAAFVCAVGLPAAGEAEETGAIGGTVTAEGGGVLEGVNVCAYATGDPSTSLGCQLTDPTGSYEIAGLAAGQYTVEFTPPAPAKYLKQFYSGAASVDQATSVAVTAGAVTPAIDATLVKVPPSPGAIAGTVKAEGGGALEGVNVCIYGAGAPGVPIECKLTGPTGKYEVIELPAGQYTVEFTPPAPAKYFTQFYSGAVSVDQATLVEVTAGALTPGIDATLVKVPPSPGAIGGTVNAEGGGALEGVNVCAYASGAPGTPVGCQLTGPSGIYEIAGLAAGQYTVEFVPPAPAQYLTQFYSGATSADQAASVAVTEGALTPGVDATLVKVPPSPGEIGGTVTGAKTTQPVADVNVCAVLVGAAGSFCAPPTGANGTYEITGLAEGQYTVEFAPPAPAEYFKQFWVGATSVDQATPVAVTAGHLASGIDAQLQKPPSGPGKIRGKVTAADTSQPVEGVEVCIQRVGVAGSLCEKTASNGDYAFSNLVPDEYLITFEPQGPKQNLLSLAYPNKEIWETPTPVTVSPGGEKVVNVALQTGGQISGTVRLAATGAPVAGVRVCLTEAEFYASLACLTTPSSGAYRFTSIWPGKFKVIFSAAAGEFPDATPIADAYSTQWWNGQPTYATATPITVTPPAVVAGVDASLAPLPGPVVATPTPSATTASPAATTPGAVAAATAKSKPLKCRTGFAKRKVKGVQRCVKLKKHKKKAGHAKQKKAG